MSFSAEISCRLRLTLSIPVPFPSLGSSRMKLMLTSIPSGVSSTKKATYLLFHMKGSYYPNTNQCIAKSAYERADKMLISLKSS